MMSECSLSWRGQGHVSNFCIVDLENFATASRLYTRHGNMTLYKFCIVLYTQLVRGRFVYDTSETMKATRSRHG